MAMPKKAAPLARSSMVAIAGPSTRTGLARLAGLRSVQPETTPVSVANKKRAEPLSMTVLPLTWAGWLLTQNFWLSSSAPLKTVPVENASPSIPGIPTNFNAS